ncbi:MAG TPA: V-type ATPase subunit [Nitrospiria bacterium]|nr:V-type ATPase subunit [Nitrospiria bacterium]
MSDFNCLAARLGAMRSRLLTRRAYEELIVLPDFPAILAALLNGPYGPAIEAAGEAEADPVKIEEGLRRDFSATLTKLLRMSGDEPRVWVEMLLAYWDLYNLKTILRGKQILLPPEEIVRSLIPTATYDEPALRELAKQPSLRAVVDLLLTWRSPHAAPLTEALRDYHEARDLYLLELALDRFYFRQPGRIDADGWILESERSTHQKSLRAFLGHLADKTNLMTALKMADERAVFLERGRFFLPGGTSFPYGDFVKVLEAGGLAEALLRVRATRFGPVLAGLGEPPPGLGTLAWVEKQLERATLRTAHRIHRTDPLGVGVVMAFLWDKIHELMNLRMIVRGRLVNLPEPTLLGLLTMEV